MDSKGYYKTLGLSENASQDEIKKAFRKLSIKLHPDKQAGKSDKEKKEAEAKFKEINEAYQVLSDEEKKRRYDSGFGDGFTGSHASGYSSGFDFGGFDFDEFGFNGAGFDFSNLFGHHNAYNTFNQQQRQRQPEKGSDIKMTIPVTIEDIFSGCKKKVKYQRNVRCPNCHGAGGTNKHTCPKCNGSGTVTTSQQTPFGFMRNTTTCPQCKGTGYVTDSKCPTCNGAGFKKEDTILEVDFIPGMLEGFSIVYHGKGNESNDIKGATGDFYAVCKHVYDKDRYQIVNNVDVYERIEIPYYDALLGCEYILEKPNHKKIKVNIPSCIPNGKHLKLVNEGILSGNIKGDYILVVIYKIPTTLSDKEKTALETIKNEMSKDNNK